MSLTSICRARKGGFRGDVRVALGPPGCGKSTWLEGRILAELEGGTESQGLACVTFTRAARDELRARLQRRVPGKDAWPWLRTIHGACFKLLELRREDVVDDGHWAKFGAQHGYQFTPTDKSFDAQREVPGFYASLTEEDRLRSAYDWGRNLRIPVEQLPARSPDGLHQGDFLRFVERYERFKRVERLRDYADLLQDVLDSELRPPVHVAVIDEAQDLAPLQFAVCEMWFRDCERVYVAGDDDQAVYGFQGADPSWLLRLT